MGGLLVTKLLSILIYPLGAGIVLLGLATLFSRNRLRLVLVLVIAMLWIPAMPLVAHWASAELESRYPPRSAKSLPVSDAIILLGGIFGAAADGTEPDLGDAGDRVLEAWRLYRAGKGQA